jgi:asparagine synthase (glutamine-hydrolysing)
MVVRRFAAAMIHRGPDGGGFFFGGPIALAHRRLSIVDLSDAGLQPMTNEDGQVVIVVNGEIYNHRELRAALEGRGHRFRSRSDSEVVAHLYEEVGSELPRMLRGMFALAVYDARSHKLLLARDRFGEKPIYYAQRPDGFAFASELTALLADPGTSAEISPAALDLYLSLQYVPAPDTAFAAVRKLPAGCMLEVSAGGTPCVRPYYRLPVGITTLTRREAVSRLRDNVENAVQTRLMSDVPLGAFLSGGLDSAIVVACMARASTRPVKTFSVGLVGSDTDDLKYARLVAQRWNTDHHELLVEPDAVSLLPRIVRQHGEPFGDSSALPTRLLCELARRTVTVALSGDGADEGFAGYGRYRWAEIAARLGALPAPLLALVRLLLRLPLHPRRYTLRQFERNLDRDEVVRYLHLVGHFSFDERAVLYGPLLRTELGHDAAREIFHRRLEDSLAGDSVSRLCELDVHTYLADDIFTKVDRASMTFGLEARAPFVDEEVIELGAALPGKLKLRRGVGKYLLRRAFEDLVPAPVLARRKKGFALPLDRWFNGPLRDWAHDVLLSTRARQRGLLDMTAVERLLARHEAGEDHGERIWSLVVLEMWQREMLDGRARLLREVEGVARELPCAPAA